MLLTIFFLNNYLDVCAEREKSAESERNEREGFWFFT